MAKKTLDSTLVSYGIRRDDLQLIKTLATERELDAEWVAELLRTYHDATTGEKALDDTGIKKLLDRELAKISR